MSEIIQISLDEMGAMLIPAPIRERLHLLPGMTLVVERGEQGGVRLEVRLMQSPLVEKEGILVARVIAVGDISNSTRHERDRRVFSLLQRVGL